MPGLALLLTRKFYAPPADIRHMMMLYCALNNYFSTLSLISFLPSSLYFALSLLQTLAAGDLVKWDPNGNGYYIYPKARWYVESGRYDEKGAGGGLGQWDRDHHYDVWGKVNRTTKEEKYLMSQVNTHGNYSEKSKNFNTNVA
jgi:hypothetical protein